MQNATQIQQTLILNPDDAISRQSACKGRKKHLLSGRKSSRPSESVSDGLFCYNRRPDKLQRKTA
ncbi:hypothetical protein HMPREF9120_02806 [Neisseria sp. oral taxon 020 str. F0370]|nr:hypothetical protein HMPREF9120_02806 [Neisseria sp. oral taxon 020 str. F0370]